MRFLYLVPACALLVACGSEPGQSQTSGGSTGSVGGSVSGGAGDASVGVGGAGSGTGGGGGSEQTPLLPPNPEHGGFVEVLSGTLQDGTNTISGTMLMAFFWDAVGASAGSCNAASYGACSVVTCSGGMPATAANVSAGAITVTGKKSMTIAPDASNDYKVVFDASLLWDPGEPVSITAAGATVPTFTRSPHASSWVTITSPPAPAMDASLSLDRTHDLNVTWTGGAAGVVTTLWKTNATDPAVVIRCAFPASAGSGTIPETALAALPAGASGDVLILGGAWDSFDVGDYTVEVGVDSIPSWGTQDGTASFTTSD